MRMLLILSLLHLSLSELACAAAKHKRVPIDLGTKSTIVDGDSSVVIVGCDRKPSVGFAYCRVREGDASDQFISLVVPPVQCNRDACAFFKIWNSQGVIVWGGEVPKGQIAVRVDWKTLLGRNTFEIYDRGFWTINETIYFLDKDGREREVTAQGDIVLRVHKKEYVPLQNVEADPNFVWNFSQDGFIFKFTSALRSYVGVIPDEEQRGTQ